MVKRRIKSANVSFLSLVPRGANRIVTAFKADEKGVADIGFEALVVQGEKFEEKGELLAVAYAKGFADSQGDIVDSDAAIDSMMGSFLTNGAKLDLRHNEIAIPAEKAQVLESFKVQKGDARFTGTKDYDGNPVDVTGAWAVAIKIHDPELRRAYRDGEFKGVSFGGKMLVEALKADDSLLKRIALKLGVSLPALKQETPAMTLEEISALAKKSAEEAVAAYKAGLEAEAKKAADEKIASEAAAKKAADDLAAATKKAAEEAVAAYKAGLEAEAKKAADEAAEKAKKECGVLPPSNGPDYDQLMAKKSDEVIVDAKKAVEELNKRRGLAK